MFKDKCLLFHRFIKENLDKVQISHFNSTFESAYYLQQQPDELVVPIQYLTNDIMSKGCAGRGKGSDGLDFHSRICSA